VSGASRDRTGDLLLAKSAPKPLTRCRTLPLAALRGGFVPSECSYVVIVFRKYLLPTCSLTVWASANVKITTHRIGSALAHGRNLIGGRMVRGRDSMTPHGSRRLTLGARGVRIAG
jgi:hypothetical protein